MTSIPELPGEDTIGPFDRGLIPGLTRGSPSKVEINAPFKKNSSLL